MKIKLLVLYMLLLTIPCKAQVNSTLDSTEAKRYNLLAKKHLYNNPKAGKEYARAGIGFARAANHLRLEAANNNTLGLCHRNLSEYDSAITAFQKAAILFKQADTKAGYYNALNNTAMNYFYKGNYEKANAQLLEVIKEADKYKLSIVLSNAYQNLGILNTSQERYTDALKNFKLAEYHHGLSNDVRGKAGSAINQAFIYFKHLRQYDKAIAIYNRVIPVKQNLGDEKGVGICYNNIAEIFLIQKDYSAALAAINKAIAIRLKVNDQFGLANSYYALADIYFTMQKYALAEKYAGKSVVISEEIGAKKEHADALQLLSEIQAQNKDMALAYSNYVKSAALKDSLLNRENFARMAELEKRYESERKERQILSQRAQIAEKQLKIDSQKNIIFLAFAMVLLAIMAGLLVYNNQKIKTIKLEKEAQLKDALLVIETQAKLQEQRMQISRDLHDNIGSQLTFIISSLDNLKYSFNLASLGLTDKITGIRNFTKETITELRDTIWAMNKEEITLLDLKTRISNFINNAKAASKGIEFSFDIDPLLTDSISFSSLKGISLYRVIQEAVHNAIKHANATEINVSIKRETHEFTITITDNGTGFTPGEAIMSNGITNIKRRIADCGGTTNLISSQKGTTVIVTLK